MRYLRASLLRSSGGQSKDPIDPWPLVGMNPINANNIVRTKGVGQLLLLVYAKGVR